MGLISQVEAAIAKGKFPAKPGHFCGWCAYSSQCPAADNIPADVRPIATADDAKAVAEELAVLERKISVRKEALKAYCNVNGAVEANGLQYGFFLVNSAAIENVKEFARLLTSHNIDPAPYLSANMTKSKKLLSNPALCDELKALLKDKSYTSFKSKKAGGEDNAA